MKPREAQTFVIHVCPACGGTSAHDEPCAGEAQHPHFTVQQRERVTMISLDAAVAAIIERYCDTSRGILCSDFRQAADFLRDEFGSGNEEEGIS